MTEHAVLVHLKPPADQSAGLDVIEDSLIAAIDQEEAGEFDGHEIALDGSGATLYMYGPDADALWGAVSKVLRDAHLGPGSFAIKRYGEPGAAETRIDLS